MNFLLVALVALLAILVLIIKRNSEQCKYNYKQHRTFIISKISKIISKDVNALIDPLFSVSDKYGVCPKLIEGLSGPVSLEELDRLNATDRERFDELYNCGYVRNSFILTALALWLDSAAVKTEQSLKTFIRDCLKPILYSPNFLAKKLSYVETIEWLSSKCM